MAGSDPRSRVRGWRALAFAAAAGLAFPAVAATPQRVVSLHLCTDQLLLGLADRAQIASVSRYAGDPQRSHMAASAAGLARNLGTAEEVLAHRADLVLSLAPASRPTVAALQALGIRVLDLPLPQDFAAIRAQTRQVAALLGQPARGEALIYALDRRLAAATADAPALRPVAAIWQPGGFTNGRGSLEDAVLRAAGFDNLAAAIGIGPLGQVPLERLVLQAPDLIVNWMGDETAPSLARDSYDHPALRRAARGTPFVPVPPRLWTCGAWFTAEAVEILADARRRLGAVEGQRTGSQDRPPSDLVPTGR